MDILKDIKKWGKKITNTVSELEEKYEVSEKFDNLKDKAEDLYDDVKGKVEELDDEYGVSKKAKNAAKTVSKKAGEVYDSVSDKVEAAISDKIEFDDFMKVELKMGKVLEAEEVKKSKKLLKLTVDFGEEEPRQIISGIKENYSTDEITGKTVLFATNLLPRKIMGLESNGMILGLSDKDGFSILTADKKGDFKGVQAG